MSTSSSYTATSSGPRSRISRRIHANRRNRRAFGQGQPTIGLGRPSRTPSRFRRRHTVLAVDAGGGAGMIGLLGGAHLPTQGIMEPVQGPVPSPAIEVPPDGAPGREVDGQVAPLATGPEDVEDGVEDVAHRGLAGPSEVGLGGQVGLDQCPLVIGEIARVMVHSHAITTLVTPRMFDLWDSH